MNGAMEIPCSGSGKLTILKSFQCQCIEIVTENGLLQDKLKSQISSQLKITNGVGWRLEPQKISQNQSVAFPKISVGGPSIM